MIIRGQATQAGTLARTAGPGARWLGPPGPAQRRDASGYFG